MSKKLIALIVIILAAGIFFLRGKLFGSNGSVELPPPLPVAVTPTAPPPPPETAKSVPAPQPQPRPVSQKYPPYKGRDPSEVRPVPEEVKLFSDVKKQEIYKGIENYGQAVKANPDFFQGWVAGGILKKVIGDYEGARDMWEYVSLIRPANSISFANLGELYWRYLPDFPKAELNFKTSIKNKPNDVFTYVSLSDLYYYSYTAKADLAVETLLDGVKANPNDPNIKRAVAALYERKKDYVKALEWWKKVAALEPNDASLIAAIKVLESKVK